MFHSLRSRLSLLIMGLFAAVVGVVLDVSATFAQNPTPVVTDYSTIVTSGITQAGSQFPAVLAGVTGLSLGIWAFIKGLNWVRGMV